MSIFTKIFRGTVANDKTGDPLREGGQIVNDNFDITEAALSNRLLRIDSVEDIAGLVGVYNGQQISLKGYYSNSSADTGLLYWDSAKAKSDHNGVSVFSPTVPWSDDEEYFKGTSETDASGYGVWVKLENHITKEKKEAYIERLKGLISSGDLVFSVLGDSTEAGSTYAQCAEEKDAGWPNYVCYQMMRNDPAFIELSEDIHGISYPFNVAKLGVINALALPYPSYQEIKSNNRKIEFYTSSATRSIRNKFTVYVNERTTDTAATFRLTVRDASNDNILYQGEIDTYVAAETFGSVGSVDVQGRIAKRTVTLSSSIRKLKVTVDNFATKDRGNGVAVDGTAAIYGFSSGKGVEFHNLSVSSTTLKNNSAANQARGVTTNERLALAQSFNTNVFLIGFGTNDSKDGVSSLSEFRDEYQQLIDDIISTNPDAIPILSTDPRGLASPYENNTYYNQMIRSIAEKNGYILLDVEKMSDTLPDLYLDNVHPSRKGCRQIAEALCSLIDIHTYNLGSLYKSLDTNKKVGEFIIAADTAIPTASSEIFSQDFERYSNAAHIVISANIVLREPLNSHLNSTLILKLNGVELDRKRVATLDASGVIRMQLCLSSTYTLSGDGSLFTVSVDAEDFTRDGTTVVEDRACISYQWI